MDPKVRESVTLRVAAFLGVIGAVLPLASICLSVALSPWFSWEENALSDLGVSAVAPIFNCGMIVSGAFTSIFAVGMAWTEKGKPLGLAGAIILLLSSISLAGVGLFSEAYGIIHFWFSLAFFVSLILSSLIIGLRFALVASTRHIGAYALSTGLLGILSWSFIRYQGVAIPEALSSFPSSLWLIVLCVRLYRLAIRQGHS